MGKLVRTKFDRPDAYYGRYYIGGGGGGGGDGVKYDNLEKLYEEQAASARLLRNIAEANLPGATQAYVGEVQNVLAPDFAERRANLAGADMASANAMERAATERNLASMGVNPNDPRFAGSMRSTQLSNAARMAAGKNLTRNEADQFQLNVAKDAVGTFTGQSNNAATQMGNAASGLGSIYTSQANQQMAKDQAQSNAIGNAVGGSLMAWSMFKDGGKVRGIGLKGVRRHADGGSVQSPVQSASPQGAGWSGVMRSIVSKIQSRPNGNPRGIFGGGALNPELKGKVGMSYDEYAARQLDAANARRATPAAPSISSMWSAAANTYQQDKTQKEAERAAQAAPKAAPDADMSGEGGTQTLNLMQNKDGGKVKKIERHFGGGFAGSQQGNQGFLQMQQIAPPPVAQAPQQQSSMLNPMSMAATMKAGKDFKAAGGMEGMAARNTDKIGKVAGVFDEQAGNAIQSYSRGMTMSPDQANTAAEAYVEAAKSATDPALADAYMNTAANIKAGAGLPAAAPEAFAAANEAAAASSGANILAAGAEAGGSAAAGSALSAAASSAAPSAFGASAPALGSGLALEAGTAGTVSALGQGSALGLGAAGATGTAATTAATTGLGAAAGAIGAALPWVGAAYAVGSLLDWWNEGGQVGTQNKGMSEEEAMRRFSDAFNAGEVNDLRAGGDVPGEWEENRDTVPALLVPDEFVLNAEASALMGDKELERLNAKGLALREQGITPHDIKRGIGLRGLKKVKA